MDEKFIYYFLNIDIALLDEALTMMDPKEAAYIEVKNVRDDLISLRLLKQEGLIRKTDEALNTTASKIVKMKGEEADNLGQALYAVTGKSFADCVDAGMTLGDIFDILAGKKGTADDNL